MSNSTYDIIELPETPSVKVVDDREGASWTCWGSVDESRPLSQQGCERTDGVTYDRGFGG